MPVFILAAEKYQSLDAVKYLGEMGPDAAAAVPTLIRAMQTGSQTLRQAASDALKKIDQAAWQKAQPIK